MNFKRYIIVFLPLIFIIALITLAIIKKPNLKLEKKEIPAKTEFSNDIAAVNDRAAVYDIITQETQNPKITKVIINPLYPSLNEKQTILVEIQDRENLPITDNTKINIKIIDETKEYNLFPQIKKINGNNDFTLMVWQAEWDFEAKIEKEYLIEIEAKNSKGQNHLITLTITK